MRKILQESVLILFLLTMGMVFSSFTFDDSLNDEELMQTTKKSKEEIVTGGALNSPIRVSAAQGSTVPESKDNKGARWTFMMYLNADNDLEDVGIADLNELEAGIKNASDITVIVLMDRSEDYDTTNGDWTGTRLYKVMSDDSGLINSMLLEDKGEVNMGQSSVLTEFINYCFANFSADHYILDLWGHGAGIDGICFDYTNWHDKLTIEEMQAAIEASEAAYNEKIDIICHDACLMGMIEVAFELRNVADYFVSSEETVPDNGYDYKDIINRLLANTSMTPQQVANEIVNSYHDQYTQESDTTLSAIELSTLSNIIPYVNNFAGNLSLTIPEGHTNAIINARADTAEFDDNDFIDFIHFAENIEANTTLMSNYPNLQASVTALIDRLNECIFSNYQHPIYSSHANGLSIYMPYGENVNINRYNSSTGNYAAIDWITTSTWRFFLSSLITGRYVMPPPSTTSSTDTNLIVFTPGFPLLGTTVIFTILGIVLIITRRKNKY
ncbi:MAG: clostripain-related cysteine peptidase [Candidatus Hodarchaeota archaeon]